MVSFSKYLHTERTFVGKMFVGIQWATAGPVITVATTIDPLTQTSSSCLHDVFVYVIYLIFNQFILMFKKKRRNLVVYLFNNIYMLKTRRVNVSYITGAEMYNKD